jgi:hypothetical protein
MGAGLASALRRSIFRAPVGPINFASKDGSDAAFEAGFVKLDRAMQVAVIGHGDRRHPQLDRPRNEFLDPTEPVQERVFGVQVEVGECRDAGTPASEFTMPEPAIGRLSDRGRSLQREGEKLLCFWRRSGVLLPENVVDRTDLLQQSIPLFTKSVRRHQREIHRGHSAMTRADRCKLAAKILSVVGAGGQFGSDDPKLFSQLGGGRASVEGFLCLGVASFDRGGVGPKNGIRQGCVPTDGDDAEIVGENKGFRFRWRYPEAGHGNWAEEKGEPGVFLERDEDFLGAAHQKLAGLAGAAGVLGFHDGWLLSVLSFQDNRNEKEA